MTTINKKPPFFKYLPSWIISAFVWIVAQLPYRLLIALGKGLGKLFESLLKSRKKVVEVNLSICFPELKPDEKKTLVNQHFLELGIMLTQTIKAFLGSTKIIEKHAIINGREHIDNCLKKGQGILFVAGHFTALDMGAKILGEKYPAAGMYREHKHPVTEYIVKKSRLKYADKMFKRDELRAIVKYLKSGGLLWYAPDQDYRRGQSEFVPFFGRQASTITATHQIARMSKCKVLFFHTQRNQHSPYYTLTVSPPMEDFPSKDIAVDTARVNQGIEEMIEKNKAEYLWVHKRFKTTPEGKNSPY